MHKYSTKKNGETIIGVLVKDYFLIITWLRLTWHKDVRSFPLKNCQVCPEINKTLKINKILSFTKKIKIFHWLW